MKKSFKCLICGYVHVGGEAPGSCPVCAASAAEFIAAEEEKAGGVESTGLWKCSICGYIHEGSEPPEECPVCTVKKENFIPHVQAPAASGTGEKARIVIIGGGIAGLAAAEEIRRNSAEAEITVLSSECRLPYYRLNLTRYLSGDIDGDSLEIYSGDWYQENRIKMVCGKEVAYIHKEKREVELSDNTAVPYDRLIIAMGAHALVPPIEGSSLQNVVAMRKVEDADFVMDKLGEIDSCICIGGGILGLETAGAIARSGVKVQLLEGAEWLMPRQLNKNASKVLKAYLKSIGVEVFENIRIKEITGSESCDGICLESGEVLAGQLVVITAGVRPNTHLARKAGLEVEKGLVVNSRLRTSDEHIYGAGDIAEHHGVLYGLWNVAQSQGKVAGLNALGIDTVFEGVPRSAILKVLDIDLLSIGEFTPLDGSYYQFEKEEGLSYYSFTVRDGKMVGSIVIGDKTAAIKAKQAVEKGAAFPLDSYGNADSILNKLLEGE